MPRLNATSIKSDVGIDPEPVTLSTYPHNPKINFNSNFMTPPQYSQGLPDILYAYLVYLCHLHVQSTVGAPLH